MTKTGQARDRILIFALYAWNMTAAISIEAQLESAIHREIVAGDLKGAIEQYRAIAAAPAVPKPVAARAILHLGQCLEKSGRRNEAREAYSRVTREFADQTGAAAHARAQLAELDNSIPGPLNLKFDQGEAGKLPQAWFVPALPKDADRWAQLRSKGCLGPGNCAVVLVPDNAPAHVGNLMQSFSAAAYRGKTVRLRAWLRLESSGPDDRAQMWLSVDRANDRQGFFDNMSDRSVRSSEWTPCEIHTRVDADATFIKFGVMSIGKGRVWVDNVTFEAAASRP